MLAWPDQPRGRPLHACHRLTLKLASVRGLGGKSPAPQSGGCSESRSSLHLPARSRRLFQCLALFSGVPQCPLHRFAVAFLAVARVWRLPSIVRVVCNLKALTSNPGSQPYGLARRSCLKNHYAAQRGALSCSRRLPATPPRSCHRAVCRGGHLRIQSARGYLRWSCDRLVFEALA